MFCFCPSNILFIGLPPFLQLDYYHPQGYTKFAKFVSYW